MRARPSSGRPPRARPDDVGNRRGHETRVTRGVGDATGDAVVRSAIAINGVSTHNIVHVYSIIGQRLPHLGDVI